MSEINKYSAFIDSYSKEMTHFLSEAEFFSIALNQMQEKESPRQDNFKKYKKKDKE